MAIATRIRVYDLDCSFGNRHSPAMVRGGPSSVQFQCHGKVRRLSRKLGSGSLVASRRDENFTSEMKFFIYDPSILLSYEALRRMVHQMLMSMPRLCEFDLSADNWRSFVPHDIATALRNREEALAADAEGRPAGALHLVVRMRVEVMLIHNEPEALLELCKETVMQSSEPASSEQCPICMEEFRDGATPIDLPCSHAFHGDCIALWLHRGTTCPVCRLDMRGLLGKF